MKCWLGSVLEDPSLPHGAPPHSARVRARLRFRRLTNNTLLAFWRTVEDAKSFAARPEHRQATRDLYEHRWQYSHFAAMWEIATNHNRVIFCPACRAVTSASEQRSKACGTEFLV